MEMMDSNKIKSRKFYLPDFILFLNTGLPTAGRLLKMR